MPVQVPTAPCVRSEAWRGSPLQMGCNQQLAHGLLRAAAWPGLRGPFSPHAAEGAPRPARRELATAPCRAAGCAAPAEALSALKERARCRQGLQSMFGARTRETVRLHSSRRRHMLKQGRAGKYTCTPGPAGRTSRQIAAGGGAAGPCTAHRRPGCTWTVTGVVTLLRTVAQTLAQTLVHTRISRGCGIQFAAVCRYEHATAMSSAQARSAK